MQGKGRGSSQTISRRARAAFGLIAFTAAVSVGSAAGLLLPAAGLADGPDVGTATSTGGLVAASSSLTSSTAIPGPDRNAVLAGLVIPDNAVAVHAASDSVDFAKPWAWFDETYRTPRGPNDVQCYTVTNVSSWSAGEPNHTPTDAAYVAPGTPAPLDGVSFDVSCPDGYDFEHYRVTYNEGMDPWGKPWPVFDANDPRSPWFVDSWAWVPGLLAGGLGYTVQSASYDSALVTVHGGWREMATAQLCGFRADGSKQCWEPAPSGVRIEPSLISVTGG